MDVEAMIAPAARSRFDKPQLGQPVLERRERSARHWLRRIKVGAAIAGSFGDLRRRIGMKRLAMGFMIVVVLQTGVARATLAAPSDHQASIERGWQIARRNCTGCHAIGPDGDSPNASAPPFRELYRRYPAGALDEAFQDGLLNRHPAMPEFRFMQGEITDLTAYVRSVQGGGGLAKTRAPFGGLN